MLVSQSAITALAIEGDARWHILVRHCENRFGWIWHAIPHNVEIDIRPAKSVGGHELKDAHFGALIHSSLDRSRVRRSWGPHNALPEAPIVGDRPAQMGEISVGVAPKLKL